MRCHHVAVLGLSALLAAAFLPSSRPAPVLAATFDDDDDDEKPKKGPRLAAGKALGLALTLTSGGKADVRPARLVALGVPAGSAPSPFLPAGRFRATWKGDLNVPFRGECSFSAAGRGSITVMVNGKAVFDGSGDDLSSAVGSTAKLKKGANALVVIYDSPPTGDAFIRLSWTPEDAPREPLPPEILAHDASFPGLADSLRLREGRELLAGLRCLKCHAPASPIAGPSSMPELATDAPSLADVGSRLDAEWMARWIADPKSLRPAATMPKMFHGGAGQARDVAAYLTTLGAPADAAGPAPAPEAVTEGGRLFANLGCVGCHTLPDRDDWAKDPKRIPLRLVGAKWRPKALVAFLQEPARHYAWIRMPNFHLSKGEAEQLAAYVSSPPKVDLAPAEAGALADPARGRALVETSGCLDCHALPGSTNAAKAPSLAQLPAGLRSIGCLAPSGDAERKAPDFGLSDGQGKAVLAFLGIGLDSLARDCAPEFAERQIKALNCAACHKRDGSDDAWTDLQVETAPLLEGVPLDEKDPEGHPYPAAQPRPSLTWIGEKLKPEWAAAFIAGKIDYKPRPYLRARMPAFATRAEGLADGLALGHGYPTISPPDPASDPDSIPVAKQLVSNTGLNCVSCHTIGKAAAVGVFEAPGINFARVKERLRRDYYDRWLRAPIKVEPDTKMPTYFNGDASVLPTILGGKADAQIDALWNYLLQGQAIEPPGN